MKFSKGEKQLTVLPNCNTYEPLQPAWSDNPRGAVRHTYIGNNQQLSNWSSDPLKKRKIMSGTRNLTNNIELIKSFMDLSGEPTTSLLLKEHNPSTNSSQSLTTF